MKRKHLQLVVSNDASGGADNNKRAVSLEYFGVQQDKKISTKNFYSSYNAEIIVSSRVNI